MNKKTEEKNCVKTELHRFTVDIPKDLFTTVRFLSIATGLTVRKTLIKALTAHLKTPEAKRKLQMLNPGDRP